MRVAIVYPEVYDIARFQEKRKEMPPFGALYLAAVLQDKEIDVSLFKIKPNQIQLDLTGFDAVGFSISSSATYNHFKEARSQSIIGEKAFVFAGGVHASFYPEETLIDLDLDAVCIGEGEETILDLLENKHSLNKVKGICYRESEDLVRTMPRAIIADLDKLPLPARNLLGVDNVVMENRLSGTNTRMVHIMCSRGCPYSCTFCANFDKQLRYRSGKNIREELIHLIEMYGIEGFCVADINFIINKGFVTEICQRVKGLNLKWSALARVDNINEEVLKILFDSGCIEIRYGIESGSQKILDMMKKRITHDQIIQAVIATKKAGIKVKGYLVHGFPGENLETTRETIDLLKNIEGYVDRMSLFRFVPLPGSYVYENHELFALRGTKYDKDWDGNWEKYHIYNNDFHWWGNESDFQEMQKAYEQLKSYVDEKWPEEY